MNYLFFMLAAQCSLIPFTLFSFLRGKKKGYELIRMSVCTSFNFAL
jgi:hypothetical protein